MSLRIKSLRDHQPTTPKYSVSCHIRQRTAASVPVWSVSSWSWRSHSGTSSSSAAALHVFSWTDESYKPHFTCWPLWVHPHSVPLITKSLWEMTEVWCEDTDLSLFSCACLVFTVVSVQKAAGGHILRARTHPPSSTLPWIINKLTMTPGNVR